MWEQQKQKSSYWNTESIYIASNMFMEAVFKTKRFDATICSKGLERRRRGNNTIVVFDLFLPRYPSVEDGYYVNS